MSHTGQNPLAHEPSKTCKDVSKLKWLYKPQKHEDRTEQHKPMRILTKKEIKIIEKGLPQKKGCGKMFGKVPLKCGEDKEVLFPKRTALCPSCSGNHSPQDVVNPSNSQRGHLEGNHTRQTKPKKRGDNNQTPATSFSDGDTGQPAEKEPDRATTLSGSDFDLSEKDKETFKKLEKLEEEELSGR